MYNLLIYFLFSNFTRQGIKYSSEKFYLIFSFLGQQTNIVARLIGSHSLFLWNVKNQFLKTNSEFDLWNWHLFVKILTWLFNFSFSRLIAYSTYGNGPPRIRTLFLVNILKWACAIASRKRKFKQSSQYFWK